PAETLVTFPAGRLGEREVDLHFRAAVAEAPTELVVTLEQTPVELGRGHVGDDGTAGAKLLAVRNAHASRAAVLDEDALDVPSPLARPAMVLDQPHERLDQARTPAARDRHPALLDGEP